MLLEGLRVFLSPLIFLMEKLLAWYTVASDSAGIAVLLLAITFAVLTYPLQRLGRQVEGRIAEKNATVQASVQQLDKTLKGEERFNAVEAIYQQYKFHPAANMLSGASFLFQLPFLLAAVLLFTDEALLGNVGFIGLEDLSQPDCALMIGGVCLNILPILLFLFILWDAYLFYPTPTQRRRFIVLSLVLCALIFNLPSGLVLYWMTLTLSASAVARLAAVRQRYTKK